MSEVDDVVRINSSSPSQIRKLREHPRFEEVPGRYADGLTVEFVIPVEDFVLTKGAKRIVSAEERARLAERFRPQAA
ncbi:hypothetical protein ACTXKE_02695 [Brachybacterium alimentarium]|uniref:hypothetical protein n=1 Tax=Brachybacterium alimentarium TaxID=47845 RepID=UPI003FD1E60B